MVKVGEARIFPVDVEEAVYTIPELTGEYQIVLKKPDIQDVLEVSAECATGVERSEALKKRLEEELRKSTGVKSNANLLAYGELSRGPQFKAQRLVKA